jgi:hypothetical protein
MEKLHLNKQGTKIKKTTPKLNVPDYTLEGVASKPKFYDKDGNEIEKPNYRPRFKFW